MRLPWPKLVLYTLCAAAVLTALFAVIDAAATGEAISAGDVLTDFAELLLISAAMVATSLVVDRMRRYEDEAKAMRADLAEASEAGRVWREQSAHVLQGVSAAVAETFASWGLTEAEADVAALLVKGVSVRDIARQRRTSEATIQQQAQAIYRKSGLVNRSELAAFFLEDLFDIAAAQSAFRNLDRPRH
jgi:DNA-binding CsgD family transcriptional regulator